MMHLERAGGELRKWRHYIHVNIRLSEEEGERNAPARVMQIFVVESQHLNFR